MADPRPSDATRRQLAEAVSKAAAEAKALEDATRPPKIVPRAPKSMSAEQLAAPVFSADEFGGEVTAGGLVLPKASDGADDADAAAAADDDDDAAAAASEAPASSSGRKGGNDRRRRVARARRGGDRPEPGAARVVRREGLEGRPDGGVPRGQARADLIDRKSHNWFQLG